MPAVSVVLLVVGMLVSVLSCRASGEVADSTGAASYVVSRGKVVDVRFPTALRPGDLEAGCAVDLEIAHDVRAGDVLVLAEGAPARGRVENVRRRQAAGYPALLTVVVQSVTAVDGTPVAVTGVYSTEGRDRHVEAAGIALFYCICALLIPGEDVLIDKGTVVPCFVAQDTVVVLHKVTHD